MSDAQKTEREKFLYSVRQSAEALGIGGRMVWIAIERGELKVTKIGRRTLIHRDQLRKFAAKDHEGRQKKEQS
jgi:excisionase family DNA binding protein